MNNPKIIVALDFGVQKDALALVDRLDPRLCRLKVGKEMFTACGPALVETLIQRGFEVFLDLKFHDIPNTVASACKAAARLGVWMVNVHALGGRRMMEAAREALEGVATRPRLIAVTVLTSLDAPDLDDIGVGGTPHDQVVRLAALARQAGLDGIVCSGQEVKAARKAWPGGFFVVPGVRPSNGSAGDQKRVVTPAQAMADGASILVVGRPISQSPDPDLAAREIEATL